LHYSSTSQQRQHPHPHPQPHCWGIFKVFLLTLDSTTRQLVVAVVFVVVAVVGAVATETKVVGKQRQKRVPQKKAKPLLLSSSSRVEPAK